MIAMLGERGPELLLPLRAIDRCDRCGARATVRATRAPHVLLLCNHHAAKHEQALVDAGWQVDRP